MTELLLLLYIGPNGILAQHGDTDALIQLFIMIIIMAFAIIGNILKARSEAHLKKAKKPSVRSQHKPAQPSQEDLTTAQQLPIQQEKIPSVTIRPRDMHRYPRQSKRRRHIVQGPVVESQPLQEKDEELQGLGLKQKPAFPKQIATTIDLKQSLRLQPDNLRQAILFHEIIGRPLSLRDIDDGPF
jgi:hypothetical protein